MSATTVREGQKCPMGCGHPLVWCDCDDTDMAKRDDGRHLICLGCGQDAEHDDPLASSPCDCPRSAPCDSCSEAIEPGLLPAVKLPRRAALAVPHARNFAMEGDR